MNAVDAAASEPTAVLIERAGAAVARAAERLLGERGVAVADAAVLVLAGPGNNGNDGRVAARLLSAAGAAVNLVETTTPPSPLPTADLVIDAVLGTGATRPFAGAEQPSGPVLAVDLPSGLNAITGERNGEVLRATATVTFAAHKLGMLVGDGPEWCGPVEVADIGLSPDGPDGVAAWLVESVDVRDWPRRQRSAHKWNHAVWVVGGTPEMAGAPALAAGAALRAGAGYVRLSVPGAAPGTAAGPPEAVHVGLPAEGWAATVSAAAERIGALVVGPGLGRSTEAVAAVRDLAAAPPAPLVLDGDALWCLAQALGDGSFTRFPAGAPVVLTPHHGELAVLGGPVPADPVTHVRELAARLGATVVAKGPTTVVLSPAGECRLVRAGDQRLATAGTGDVLAGVIGAGLALDASSPTRIGALAAQLHGDAALAGLAVGLVASDLPLLIAQHLSRLEVA
jgi:NAD(P)H-hydrate epimerase